MRWLSIECEEIFLCCSPRDTFLGSCDCYQRFDRAVFCLAPCCWVLLRLGQKIFCRSVASLDPRSQSAVGGAYACLTCVRSCLLIVASASSVGGRRRCLWNHDCANVPVEFSECRLGPLVLFYLVVAFPKFSVGEAPVIFRVPVRLWDYHLLELFIARKLPGVKLVSPVVDFSP